MVPELCGVTLSLLSKMADQPNMHVGAPKRKTGKFNYKLIYI